LLDDNIPSSDNEGDSFYLSALEKLKAKDYEGTISDVEQALNNNTNFKSQASASLFILFYFSFGLWTLLGWHCFSDVLAGYFFY